MYPDNHSRPGWRIVVDPVVLTHQAVGLDPSLEAKAVHFSPSQAFSLISLASSKMIITPARGCFRPQLPQYLTGCLRRRYLIRTRLLWQPSE